MISRLPFIRKQHRPTLNSGRPIGADSFARGCRGRPTNSGSRIHHCASIPQWPQPQQRRRQQRSYRRQHLHLRPRPPRAATHEVRISVLPSPDLPESKTSVVQSPSTCPNSGVSRCKTARPCHSIPKDSTPFVSFSAGGTLEELSADSADRDLTRSGIYIFAARLGEGFDSGGLLDVALDFWSTCTRGDRSQILLPDGNADFQILDCERPDARALVLLCLRSSPRRSRGRRFGVPAIR